VCSTPISHTCNQIYAFHHSHCRLPTARAKKQKQKKVYAAKQHECEVWSKKTKKMRKIRWRNTNDLLWVRPADGFACDGGKTGWIPNVQGQRVWGSLATVVSRTAGDDDGAVATDAVSDASDRYIIVVLGCKSKKRRFIDSRAIARWMYGITDDDGDTNTSDDAIVNNDDDDDVDAGQCAYGAG